MAADELKQPLHAKVRLILREQILADFEHDQCFYSERQLIRNLKVSQPTVRRALRDLVAEGYLHPAPRRGFFVQKKTAVRYVGLICPASTTPLPQGTVESISFACREQDLVLNVYYAHKDEGIESLLKAIRHRSSEERLIITGLTTELTLQISAKLQERGYIHLVLGPHVNGFSGSSLAFDHNEEVDLVLDHLIGLGHERIVFIVNEPRVLFITGQRSQAVERSLLKRKLTKSSIVYCDTKEWESSFDAAYRKAEAIWNASSPKPTAIIPLSGVGAWAVMRFALTHGIRVPDQLSVIGFDPLTHSEQMPIPLTEISFSYVERSIQALKILWSSSPAPLHELVEIKLVARASTGLAAR